MAKKFTPTQELVLEVLVARHRLGETLWTFDVSSAMTKALNGLGADGYVETMSGAVEYTVRAYLTPKAQKEFLSGTYRAPGIQAAQVTGIELVASAAKSLGFITYADIKKLKKAVQDA